MNASEYPDSASDTTTSNAATLEVKVFMRCIRCDYEMELEHGCPHNPMSGLSLEATGNWPSSVWDDGRRAWWVLCDDCARDRLHDPRYCLEEVRPRAQSIFRAIPRDPA